MKINIVILFTLPFITVAAMAEEQEYALMVRSTAPAEFQELLSLKERQVEVILVSGQSFKVLAEIGYYNVRLVPNSNTIELSNFLLAQGVSQAGSDLIMLALENGVDSDPSCRGDRQTCLVTPSGPLTAVVDSINGQVRLFLDESLYAAASGKPEYVESYNPNPALINNFSLYGSHFDGESSITANDRVLLGLPYGHINSEITINSYQGGLNPDVLEMAYHLEIDQYRFMAGRSQNFNGQNTTSLLRVSSIEKEGAYFMSSRNLSRLDSNNYQRVYFYMPQSGVVEVYKEEQLLFSKAVEAGQQYITYEQIPSGVYSLTLKLKAGDKVLSEQTSAIVNTQRFNLMTGDVDFNIGVANAKYELHQHAAELPIGELAMVYRPWDPLMLGAGVTLSERAQLYQVGGQWQFSSELSLNAMLGLFTDDARYYTAQLSHGGSSLNYQRYKASSVTHVDNNESLSSVLMGGNDGYEQISLSSGLSLGEGNGYASLYYYRVDSFTDESTPSLGASLGYSFPFYSGSTLGINTSWNRANQTQNNNAFDNNEQLKFRDGLSVSLNWSMPLGDGWTASANASHSSNGSPDIIGTARKNYQINDQLSTAVEVGGGYRNERAESTALGSVNYRHAAFDMSGSGSMSDQGSNNLFANFGSSQILSSEGIHFSNQKSDSYLVIKNENAQRLVNSAEFDKLKEEEMSGGQLQIGSRGTYQQRMDYDLSSERDLVVPMGSYRPQQVKLNADNGVWHNQGDQELRAFSFPGSVMTMSTQLEREVQLLGAFNYASGLPVTSLTCEGDGCLQVDKLEDGLFKVRLREHGYYRLKTARQLCLEEGDVMLGSERLVKLPAVQCQPTRGAEEPVLWSQQPQQRPAEETTARTEQKGDLQASHASCQLQLKQGETLYSAVQPWAREQGVALNVAVKQFIEHNQKLDGAFDVTRIKLGQTLQCPETRWTQEVPVNRTLQQQEITVRVATESDLQAQVSSCKLQLKQGETLEQAIQPWALQQGVVVDQAIKQFIEYNRQLDAAFDIAQIKPGQILQCPEINWAHNNVR